MSSTSTSRSTRGRKPQLQIRSLKSSKPASQSQLKTTKTTKTTKVTKATKGQIKKGVTKSQAPNQVPDKGKEPEPDKGKEPEPDKWGDKLPELLNPDRYETDLHWGFRRQYTQLAAQILEPEKFSSEFILALGRAKTNQIFEQVGYPKNLEQYIQQVDVSRT